MSLYLVQHGVSLSKEINPDRPLSDEGRSKVEHIAKVAADYKVNVSLIKHSGKTRAEQTAEIMAFFLKPEGRVQKSSGLNPTDDVIDVAKNISVEEDIMLVGHLPFMERLASFLITGSTDKTVIKFQNGGIVCLDKDPETGSWFIKWTLMPEIK